MIDSVLEEFCFSFCGGSPSVRVCSLLLIFAAAFCLLFLCSEIRIDSFVFFCDWQGNTAVYLLYAHARICSIIRKSGKDIEELKKVI